VKAKYIFSKYANPFWWYKIGRLRLERLRKAHQTQEVRQCLLSYQPTKTDATAFQTTQLRKILHYAKTHCPYYHNLFINIDLQKITLQNLSQIPLLDKNQIRQHYDQIVSDELLYLNHHWKSTSGSEDDPLTFPASNFAADIDIEHLDFQYHQMGYTKGDKIAVFGSWAMSNNLDYQKNIFWKKNPFSSDWHGHFHYFMAYLNDATFPLYVKHLNDTQPAFINGLSSLVYRFALKLLEGKEQLHFKLKGIRLTGENCYDWQKETIRLAFSAPIYLQYGHREIAVYAFTEANQDTYFCSPYYGITEVLDEAGNHVKEGEIGEIVVTGFYNHALPFIRYRTKDLAVFGGYYQGTVRLEKLIGRISNYLINQKGEKIATIFIGLPQKIRHKVTQWQVIQEIAGKVNIYLVPASAWEMQDIETIKTSFLKEYDLLVENFITVKEEELQRKQDSAKFQFVIRVESMNK
jgi:phenylacetate-CoA ligase